MRKIKFRAWDKQWRRWIDPRDINFYGDMGWMFDRRSEEGGDVIESTDLREVALMQFTGLKDKRGKEIFSGDLIRQHGTLYEIRPCIGGFECQIWKEYKQGGAEEGSIYMFSCLLDTACEIIGNIYENPELVKS